MYPFSVKVHLISGLSLPLIREYDNSFRENESHPSAPLVCYQSLWHYHKSLLLLEAHVKIISESNIGEYAGLILLQLSLLPRVTVHLVRKQQSSRFRFDLT